MTELPHLTIAEARDGLKAKTFSATELTQAHIAAVEKARAQNAYVLETPEKALAQAKASDEKIAKGEARPMENRSGAMNELRALLRARRALYERAAHVVDTSTLGLSRSVDRVVKIAREAANGAPA